MLRFSARTMLVVILPALLVACSSSPRQRTTSRQTRLITTEEIDALRYSSAYEVVEALRPQWLRIRGRTSFSAQESVKVYLDDSLLGTPEHLRQITARSISSIRFMDGTEATTRWGLDHGHGAIIVLTRSDTTSRN
jgi:hypothetical protein